jgi:hypothetical protein
MRRHDSRQEGAIGSCWPCFGTGLRALAAGDEAHCLSRMPEAYLLENQSVVWFLARYEIEQAGRADDITS